MLPAPARRKPARSPTSAAPALPAMPESPAVLAQQLADWYRAHRRDLPWRHTTDPYAVWVSEVMLQQTQVETVKRYWQRFLERFPHPRALAEAPQDEVLSAWSGLGYYRRARLLHRAAQAMVERHAGRFPTEPAHIHALPGVGAYTGGAVLSIALGHPEPAVDGNVVRVLSRLLGVEGPVRTPDTFEATARALHGTQPPSDVTQGLMELGATVCTPRNADCGRCPWKDPCRARAMDAVARIPPPKERAARKAMHVACVLVCDDGGLWLSTRAGNGLFGGLWELPQAQPTEGARPTQARLRQSLAEELPWVVVERLLTRTDRTLTHRDLSLWTHQARFAGEPPAHLRFVTWDALGDAPLATAMRAAIEDAAAAWRALRRAP